MNGTPPDSIFRRLGRIGLWTLAAFFCHLAAAQTSAGLVRFELPFFLAVFCAVREPVLPGLTFLIPSLLFDAMDGWFASSLSHVIVFILIRRTKYFMDFTRLPGSLLVGAAALLIDRILFGCLAGFQSAGPIFLPGAVLDLAYALTAACLPFGFLCTRSRPGK